MPKPYTLLSQTGLWWDFMLAGLLSCIAGRPKLQTIWADQFTYFSLDVMLYPVFSTSPRQVHIPTRRQDAAVACI